MPPKQNSPSKTKTDKKIGSLTCGIRGPGPKYLLKTLVGYKEHCTSKYRNPAYTFGKRFADGQPCLGPGPKYLLPNCLRRGGFSLGLAGKTFDTSCTPGPKYLLPSPRAPAFTIKSRTKHRNLCFTPGPYNVKLPIPGPAFYMQVLIILRIHVGQRLAGLKCAGTPGPRLYNDAPVKLRPPMYSLADRPDEKIHCRSPGPKYDPKPMKPHPVYSFGIKHSECAPPYIVECDDQC
ncbi:Outer dense fiber protein 3 [Habropoda laboriosa]|uniref:Outer dense fiber protein 3 n=1 Tax=Habropoda laboriosa TaxID=597456 RepID=A0A0L7QNX1_9HYME|nr:Outer dense fiber protein 3 [Habropoda laboriosa]